MIKDDPKYVIKFTQVQKTNDDTVFYTIQVFDSKTNQTWTFKERYSAMRDIHDRCAKILKKNQLPDFPHRKLFGSTNDEFIQKRKIGLQIYYNSLLKEIDLNKLPDLYKFFNGHRPVKQLPKQNNVKNSSNQQKIEATKQKNIKKIFQNITSKTTAQFIDISNDFFEDVDRKIANQTMGLKLGLKSHLLDEQITMKTNPDNQFDFWSMFFVDEHEKLISNVLSMEVQFLKMKQNKEKISFVVVL